MPPEGVPTLSRGEILSLEEMERVVRLFAGLGISKIRITGGEPFIRRGLIHFLRRIRDIEGIERLYITTNGVRTGVFVSQLLEVGISGINLSLDTLQRERFFQITRRDFFEEVYLSFHQLVETGIPLKINMVVLEGHNADELLPVSRLAESHPVEVRFIERMPFSGGSRKRKTRFTAERIEGILRAAYPGIVREQRPGSTAIRYFVPGFQGTLGIIGGYSRLFCSTCNRLRMTPRGVLKTCLYDQGRLNLKEMIRNGDSDAKIQEAIRSCVGHRFKNGFDAEAEARGGNVESMSSIGG